jgi:hypothetical protein
MKGHVTEGAWRRPAFVQSDGDVAVPNRNPAFKFKFLLQTQHALEPFRTAFRTSHRQSEMADDSGCEGNFHCQYDSAFRWALSNSARKKKS